MAEANIGLNSGSGSGWRGSLFFLLNLRNCYLISIFVTTFGPCLLFKLICNSGTLSIGGNVTCRKRLCIPACSWDFSCPDSSFISTWTNYWETGNSLFQTSSMAGGHHGDSWTNKPAMRDDRVSPLSDH